MNSLAAFPVVETFHSLQGEGHHSGRSAFFIRLGGCKVSCPWCDTKNSWKLENHPKVNVNTLATEAALAISEGAGFTVITGGEPLHHNLSPLTKALGAATRRPIHIETSGVDPISGELDWITLSPKRHNPPRKYLLAHCNELKVIIHQPEDLIFAEEMASATQKQAELLLQPGWLSPRGTELAVNHVQRNSNWRLSFQSHKWLGIR